MARWAVKLTIQVEYPQDEGLGLGEITAEECVEGVSPVNDCALWAIGEVYILACKRWNLQHEGQQCQVISCEAKEMEE